MANGDLILCLNNNVTYKSIKECARDLNLTSTQRKKINLVCKGIRKSVAGYIFKYLGGDIDGK